MENLRGQRLLDRFGILSRCRAEKDAQLRQILQEQGDADGRGLAKRWASTFYRAEKPADGSLAGYLRFVGYEAPADAAPDEVGETIRRLRPRLRCGRALTPGQQRRWRRLLVHNQHDCAGMRAVCLRATEELDAVA